MVQTVKRNAKWLGIVALLLTIAPGLPIREVCSAVLLGLAPVGVGVSASTDE